MNRSEKIAYLAEVFEGAGITPGMASSLSKEVLDKLFPPLEPIEHDVKYDRFYIPLPGGVEVQTKGKGSTFRIANSDDHFIRMLTKEELSDRSIPTW